MNERTKQGSIDDEMFDAEGNPEELNREDLEVVDGGRRGGDLAAGDFQLGGRG